VGVRVGVAIFLLRFFEVCGQFVGVKVGVGPSIGIDENNTFQLTFLF